MPSQAHSLFDNSEGTLEEITQLQRGGSFTLEHIVSRGQASDPDFWYDQPKDEWVVLIRGTATLEFRDRQITQLRTGDYLLIPAHCEHRVATTSPDAHWLALHFDSSSSQ